MAFTAEDLVKRISVWATHFRHDISPDCPSPILAYQNIFALIHELKSSVQLSNVPSVRSLAEAVLKCDPILRKLAYDEVELQPQDTTALYLMLCRIGDQAPTTSIPALEEFLTKAYAGSKTTDVHEIPKGLKETFPWESLSRARYTSALRHGYSLFTRSTILALATLGTFEEQLQNELRPKQGVAIVRKLDPRPSGATLEVDALQLVAFPPKFLPPEATWNAFAQS
jgi:hypothetical protein